MSSSREESPDWLRSFEAPKHSVVTLSSDSDSSPKNSPIREEVISQKEPSLKKTTQLCERDKDQGTVFIDSGEETPVKKAPKPKSPKSQLNVEEHMPIKKKKVDKGNKREVDGGEREATKEEIVEKQTEPHTSSSRLPLVLSERVHRSKALVECEGESMDMSGDVGAVGRIVISDAPSGNHEMLLDLKGTIYKTTIVPSRTFCIVSFGQAEAKIEAVMNDFIQLKPVSNVYEAETMIEGTLDGFSFDSEGEADKMPMRQTDESNVGEDQINGKRNGKSQKKLGVIPKKGKAAGKTTKKGRRKPQIPKKAKNARK